MKHYYEDVPGLGNVVISRHAQARMEEFSLSQAALERVLLQPNPKDMRESNGILWRERDGIRLVIIEKPEPFSGAMLVKTVYRIEDRLKARK
jgi:hypothetical protein